MNTRIYIVEDDVFIADELTQLIQSFGYEVVGQSTNEKDALVEIAKCQPNLVCLDINLGQEGNGFNVAKRLNELQIPFVFVSSYFDENTISTARSFHPISYIIKPFRDKDLKVALALAFYKMDEPKSVIHEHSEKELFLKLDGDLVKINVDEVDYLKGEDNYTLIQLANGKKTMTSITLKKMEEKLAPLGFIRIHKSYVVSVKKISRISGNLVYINEKALPIGNAYRSALLSHLVVI